MLNVINIVTEDEAFDFTPPGMGATFTLRRLSADKRSEFTRKNTDEKGRPNQVGYENDVLDYCIQDWAGSILHPVTGKPAPCTRANKVALPIGVRALLLAKVGISALPTPEQEGNSETSPDIAAGTQE